MKLGHDRWTPEQEASLARLWGKVPAAAVAARLQRSVSAVEYRASRLKIRSDLAKNNRFARFKGREFYEWVLREFNTKTRRQIAKEQGVSPGTVASWITRAYKYRDEGRLT